MSCLKFTDSQFEAAWEIVQEFTVTNRERGYALWCAVNTVIDNNIPGSIVESGVGRGSSAMLIALALKQRGIAREIVLFDTFEPQPEGVGVSDEQVSVLMDGKHDPEISEPVKVEAPFERVRGAVERTGYDMRLVRFVKGNVCETLSTTQTLNIALLILDTGFYDSTLAELNHLYPRLSKGGVMIIDDYDNCRGTKKAVEEYFEKVSETGYQRPMLWVIGNTGRGSIKTESTGSIEIERYDYIPPGMEPPNLHSLFPHAVVGNPWGVKWPYLRRHVPHVWRFDDRHKGNVTGNASVEEAACLYAFAKQFAGKRGLEIGTYYGWTAAHLLAAGLRLDCVDPAFAIATVDWDVRNALDKVPGSNGYTLWAEPSPQCIDKVWNLEGEPWSFVFIDGNHDGDAPRDDASAVLPHLADDAMVMFHDLMSPHVEAGLEFFRDAGFQTRLINTMQIMGVAWRGDVVVPDHIPDPNVPYPFPKYLQKYLT